MRFRAFFALFLAAVLALGGCAEVSRNQAAVELVQPLLLDKADKSPNETVSLIVQSTATSLEPLKKAIQARGGMISEQWDFINAVSAKIPAGRVPALSQLAGIRFISWDAPAVHQNITSVNSNNVKTAYPFAVGADQVWATGNYGSNVVVSMLDSGFAPFPGADQDFGNRFASTNVNPAALAGTDPYGHGTFIAGIILGDGTLSNQEYVGIAPQASLFSVRISDNQGNASTKDLVNGLNWVYKNYRSKGIKVVNVSMQSSTQLSYKVDPVDAAVEKLWNAGLVVVVSAGNNGGQTCSVCQAPANDPYVITVGAVEDMATRAQGDDTLASWSSSGTTQDGFAKPDIFAPGAHIWSTLSFSNNANPTLAQQFPGNVSPDGHYIQLGGTSAAAPVVSGAVALLLHAHPTWTPNQVKWVLTNTAASFVNQPSPAAGELRIDRAINYSGTPQSANYGLVPSTASVCTTCSSSSGTVQWSTVQWSTSGNY